MNSFIGQLCRSPILRRATVMLVALALSSLAFSGEIHDAAQNGDLEKVKALLKANPDLVSSKDEYGRTPLELAAPNGHKDVLELLLANGADVNAKDNTGQAPLDIADADVVEMLLEHSSREFPFAIFDAAWEGNLKKVETLLKDNPNLVFSKDTNGWTPLHVAAREGYLDVAKLLLANKADVNAKINNGVTPLYLAAQKGYKDVAELLLANGADVNASANGATSLFAAAGNGNKEIVELLLANKADVNIKDYDNSTPLNMAVSGGYLEIVKLLLANKADVNAKGLGGLTSLHDAVLYGPEGGDEQEKMVELLLANKADVNAKDDKGETPLHYAMGNIQVGMGNKEIVELLRQHGGHE